MKSFQIETIIEADVLTIWEILVDTSRWPEWDPGCERVEGLVAPNAKLKVFTKQAPGRAFSLRVTELVPGERMVWTGGMPFGLFRGERTFVLERLAGGTRFTMVETFSGPMLPLIAGSLPDLSPAFAAFAAGLKTRAEAARRQSLAA